MWALGLLTGVGRVAAAHEAGLSRSEFTVESAGLVRARFVGFSGDRVFGVVVDKNHDRVLSPDELRAAEAEFRPLFEREIEVTGDGKPCEARFLGAKLEEGDGLSLDGFFTCPTAPAEVAVTLFVLAKNEAPHRHMTTLVAGDRTASRMLSATVRHASIEVPPSLRVDPRTNPSRSTLLVASAASVAVLGIVFVVGRRRSRRNPEVHVPPTGDPR